MNDKPHDAGSHEQKMSPVVQRVIDEADKRAADSAAMPARCPTPTECRGSACHGGCLEPSTREAAEHAYYVTAFDYASNPVGSRDWSLFWRGWQAYEQTGLHQPSDVVGDLSTTVMRLARELRRVDSKNDWADKALDYLKRKKLTTPLRAMAVPAPVEITDAMVEAACESHLRAWADCEQSSYVYSASDVDEAARACMRAALRAALGVR